MQSLFAWAAAVLFAYGWTVNAPPWDFGKLLGVYVVFFFVIAQLISWLIFKHTPSFAQCGRDPVLRMQRFTPAASSDRGGFRRYGESDVETLAFVRRVQGLGFKLSEIRGLLRLRGSRLQPCAPVQRWLKEKLVDVQRKLADLHKLDHELRLALRGCNKEMRKRNAHCPILRTKTCENRGTKSEG